MYPVLAHLHKNFAAERIVWIFMVITISISMSIIIIVICLFAWLGQALKMGGDIK